MIAFAAAIAAGLAAAFPSAFAAAPVPTPNPDAAEIRVTISEKGKVAQVGLVPKAGTVLNPDAPWELKIADPSWAKKLEYGPSDFDFSKGVVRVSLAKPLQEKVALPFRLVYFVCNKEKTWCKRLVYQQ